MGTAAQTPVEGFSQVCASWVFVPIGVHPPQVCAPRCPLPTPRPGVRPCRVCPARV